MHTKTFVFICLHALFMYKYLVYATLIGESLITTLFHNSRNLLQTTIWGGNLKENYIILRHFCVCDFLSVIWILFFGIYSNIQKNCFSENWCSWLCHFWRVISSWNNDATSVSCIEIQCIYSLQCQMASGVMFATKESSPCHKGQIIFKVKYKRLRM